MSTHPAHPAVFARMTREERTTAAYRGDFEREPHWKIARVAELTCLDGAALAYHVEAERGWEPHDEGYLHRVVESARILLSTGPFTGVDDC